MNPFDELHKLTAQFPAGDALFDDVQHVPASLVPKPYKSLLVHDHHMTVTMENFHSTSVGVQVLDRALEGDIYTRRILLARHDDGRIVQFGIVRFDLSYVTPVVRDEILHEHTPLGRILINHNVLRHIDVGAILKIVPGPALRRLFDCPPGSATYGRLATIFCNQQPAVDLLEISTPLG